MLPSPGALLKRLLLECESSWFVHVPSPKGTAYLSPAFQRWVGMLLNSESRQGRHMSHPNTYRGSYVTPDLRNNVMNSCSKLHFW